MRFGDFLRKRREEKGWTQPEAAIKASIEQSYLSKLEGGKSYPSEEVFARLAEAYGFNGTDLVAVVASPELAKLKEIGEVRAAMLDRQRTERMFSRGWLVATLVFMISGGACLGVANLAEDTTSYQHEYTSMGVLGADDPLDAYALVEMELDPFDSSPDYQELRQRQQDLIGRLDIERRVTRDDRGRWYVEETAAGRRNFQLTNKQPVHARSPLKWFAVPAFALLIGGFGCAFVSFRWR